MLPLTTTDAGGIQGEFAGLSEGATFSQGGFQFQITYQGGPDGTSVVLTRVSGSTHQPESAGLLGVTAREKTKRTLTVSRTVLFFLRIMRFFGG